MKSIRLRFLLISAIVITLALMATALAFIYLFERGIERRVDDELTHLVNQIAAGLTFGQDGKVLPPVGLSDQRFNTAYGGLYWQIDDPETGAQLRSRSLWDFVLPLPEDTHDAGAIHRYYLPGPDQGEVYAQERSLVVATPTGARSIRISAAIDKSAMRSVNSRFALDLIPYLIVLGLFLFTASALQLTLGLRPLTKVSNDLKKLQEHPNKRLAGPYPGEIEQLVEAVNSLLDTQESTITKSRARAADLAHSLKTPLTVLATNAEKLESSGNHEMASEIASLVHSMRTHIDHELARSRIAPGPEYRSGDAKLSVILADIIKILSKTPNGEVVNWKVDVPPEILAKIDPNDLHELMGNILDNAVKWAREEVSVQGTAKDGILVLEIEDDGPGIATEQISAMMDRGKRFDEKIAGSGLGLAIVREIVDVYGLTLTIQNRQSHGLSVILNLPIAT